MTLNRMRTSQQSYVGRFMCLELISKNIRTDRYLINWMILLRFCRSIRAMLRAFATTNKVWLFHEIKEVIGPDEISLGDLRYFCKSTAGSYENRRRFARGDCALFA
jgi:hypothetical protein